MAKNTPVNIQKSLERIFIQEFQEVENQNELKFCAKAKMN